VTIGSRLALIGGGILIAALAALAVAPEFVDWNRYRDETAAIIQARLGRAASIEGPLSLSLLPTPHLVADHLRLANIPGAADPDFATVERLSLRLRLLPLLEGRFEVSSLLLVKPQIHLERFADGRGNWHFARTAAPAAAPAPGAGALGFGGSDGAVLDRVELQDARVSFRHPRSGSVTVDALDAEGSADSADGPFQFRAKGKVSGVALAVEGTLGQLAAAETPLDLALELGNGVARLVVGGVLTGRDAATSFGGHLTVKAPHVAGLASLFAVAGAPDGRLEIQGGVTAKLHELAAQNLTIEAPGASASGYASLNLEGDPQLDLKLSTPHLDLAPWTATAVVVPGERGEASAALSGPARSANAGESGVLAFASGLVFAPPNWLAASVDLTAQAVTWRTTNFRDARLNALLANGKVTINQVGATLPGDSQVNLFGFLGTQGGKPSFDGSFESGSDDLRALLRWLAVNVDAVPADRLGVARFTGHVTATPERVKLDGAELRIDGTRIDTAVDLRLPEHAGDRPALGATFAIDTFNADAYWPRSTAPPATALSASAGLGSVTASDIAPALVPTALSAPLSGPLGRSLGVFDANLRAHVERLVAGGLSFRGIDLEGALAGGSLELNSLAVGDLDGTHGMISGRIVDLGRTPRLEAIHIQADSAEPQRLLGALGIAAPRDNPGPLTMTAALDGNAAGVTLRTHIVYAGLTADLAGKVATPLTAPGFDLMVDAKDANLAEALHLFALDSGGRAGADAVAAAFHLTGDPTRLALDGMKLRLGEVSATGQASLALTARTRLEATLTAGEVPIDRLLAGAFTETPAPRAAARAQPPAAPNSPAKAPANPDAPPPPQAAPRPAVDVGGIPDRYSHAPIDLAWMGGLDGSLTFDATALTWDAVRLAQPIFVVTLVDGTATLDRFSARLWGGDLAATAAVNSTGALSFEAKLSKGQLKEAALGVADLNLAEGVFDAELDLTATGNSPAELIGRLSGTGKFEAHDGTLRGFDLAAADERLKDPSPASLITLAQSAMKGGETKFSSLAGTIKASGGIFSTDDLTLQAEGGTVTASGAANLPARALDARAQLRFADAPDAPPLTMHLSGSLDDPRRVIDINPLQTWLAKRPKPAKPVTN
jgi:uncharacterized protein involved in outer membrane biogenesis